jgi:phage-related protein
LLALFFVSCAPLLAYIIFRVKSLRFVGSSLDDLRNFPAEARRQAGFEIYTVQRGLQPSDLKPMNVIGAGVREIRVHVLGEWSFVGCQVFRRSLCSAFLSEEVSEDEG